MARMLIVDAHLDLAYNALRGRDVGCVQGDVAPKPTHRDSDARSGQAWRIVDPVADEDHAFPRLL